MRFIRVFQYVAMILLISTLGVKFAQAAEGSLDLTLDQGFIGRPISLDLFDKSVVLSWDGSALVKPTALHVAKTSSEGISINVDNSEAFASGTRMMIAISSSITDSPALRVMGLDGTVASYRASVDRGMVRGSILAASVASIDVVSDVDAIALIANDGSVPVSETDQKMSLTLDAGFVGRSASFDLFNGDVTIAWDAKTLVKPTGMTVVSTRGGVWREQEVAANGIKVVFDDPSAVSSAGTFTIRHRALRPPKNTERPDVNVFAATTSTRSAVFSGTTVSYSVSAASGAAYAPVYCSGIMRTGLASWYKYKNCLCAASPDVPKGTLLKVSRQDDPSVSVIVKVNDYGPDRKKHPERVIDLDKVAFSKIGNTRGGVLAVTVEPVQSASSSGQ